MIAALSPLSTTGTSCSCSCSCLHCHDQLVDMIVGGKDLGFDLALRDVGTGRKQGPVEGARERGDGFRRSDGIRAVGGCPSRRGRCQDVTADPYASSCPRASGMLPGRPRATLRRPQLSAARWPPQLPTETAPTFACWLTPCRAALRPGSPDQTSGPAELFRGATPMAEARDPSGP